MKNTFIIVKNYESIGKKMKFETVFIFNASVYTFVSLIDINQNRVSPPVHP